MFFAETARTDRPERAAAGQAFLAHVQGEAQKIWGDTYADFFFDRASGPVSQSCLPKKGRNRRFRYLIW